MSAPSRSRELKRYLIGLGAKASESAPSRSRELKHVEIGNKEIISSRLPRGAVS